MQITTHTDLLNALIEKHNLKSYLEIGVQNPANNYLKINCIDKVGVDPAPMPNIPMTILAEETSDDFFLKLFKHLPEKRFDLVFIDGYHECDQVKRDFENSLKYLNETGFILIHDVLPQNEVGTRVPRETVQWWGDVYKFAMSIRNHYTDIQFVTFNIDNGCLLVWKSPGYTYTTWKEAPMNWETYQKHGKTLMNVVDEVLI